LPGYKRLKNKFLSLFSYPIKNIK